MSQQRDDCYFYFYSTCAKKKRSEIPCYWENQPEGCQKAHCAFLHLKERSGNEPTLPPSSKADASGLPLNSGLAESLGNQTEVEKAPERVDIPTSSHGLAGQKCKRSEEEKERKAKELPCKKRVKGGRKVSVRPIDWKTTFPPTRRWKQKAAEMQPPAAEDMDAPPVRKLPVAILASVPPEYTLVSVEVIKPPSSLELLPGSQEDSVAQSGHSNSTSNSSQEADETQQLSCTEAGEALDSEDDDIEKLLMEISEEELEGEIDLDFEKDADELLL